MPNRLSDATSPYLRQHADNPVDWFEWCEEAFAEASRRDVPVILSVGYATCHWCHVMAHESFEDDPTAEFMNANFVNIKVDREERPDVDRIYMDVVTATTGRGGWPMTVFLTPQQTPIFAGTYFPKESMGHHASFMEVMSAVLDAWNTNRRGALDQADHIATSIAARQHERSPVPDVKDIEHAVERMSATFDRVNGGFGTAPKFPQAPSLELLMRMAALRSDTDAGKHSLDMLIRQLTAIARGGIYDHLLGGFARYSVDSQWIIPHFEKMLYDNAQLARVYLRAWQLTDIEMFKQTAIEVLDYLDIAMADDRGGIHSAEDADSEGVEGRFAVWNWEELEVVLGGDLDLASSIYSATPEGNFEGANNLLRIVDLDEIAAAGDLDVAQVEERKRSIDERLRIVRAQRTPPSRDDKIVTAWNGLAIRAFAEAGAILGVGRYKARAKSIANFLVSEASPDGALVRSWRGKPGHRAFADDHGALAVGLFTLYQTTGNDRWFIAAEEQVNELRTHFADPAGGFFNTSDASESLITRPKTIQDNPTPSDNALAMEALQLHASFTGDTSAIDQARETMEILARDALQYPSFAGYGLAVWLTQLIGIKEVAIVGVQESIEALERTVWERFRPDTVVAIGDGTDSPVPLLEGRPLADRALAYVCQNLTCDLPVDSPDGLRASL